MKQQTNAHKGKFKFHLFFAWGYANRKRLGTGALELKIICTDRVVVCNKPKAFVVPKLFLFATEN